MKRLMALMALTVLTACDYVERADFRKERADKLYKSAMADYRAGRIDAAVEGFRAVTRKDPANASARFALACLLHDAKSDYVGAFCAYREYLAQCPESDKVPLAKERAAKCERDLAKVLAGKYGLLDKDGFVKENAALKEDARSAEVRLATAEKEVETLRLRVSSLSAERERLLAIVKGGAKEEAADLSRKPSVKEAKDLLDEEDADVDRIKMSADVAALKLEEKEEVAAGSSLLPVRRAVTNAVTPVVEQPRQGPSIPATHVVKVGDTLYGIAKRYYGRISAWKRIRDANKELISMDNRLHVGDTLRLPRE